MPRSAPDYASLRFMFAPERRYLISTCELPLRNRSAPMTEYSQDLPEEITIEVDRPGSRILSASMYREGLWFLCVHHVGLESIFKDTSSLSSTLQDVLNNLKSTKRSPRFVAFGELPGSFCMILNDDEIIKLRLPEDCDKELEWYNNELTRNQTRSVGEFSAIKGIALGAEESWIIYDGNTHIWGGDALPQGLVEALELGKSEGWSIEVAELSIFHPEEYLLVYQNGKSWYNIHHSFEDKLRSVVLEWAVMQKLEEVTFTTVASNENIAYFELLKKIFWTTLKSYPPFFNEAVVHYKRQNFATRHDIADVYEGNKHVNPTAKQLTEKFDTPRFVRDTSKVQLKRSQGTRARPKSLTFRQLYIVLFSELVAATFPVDRIVWKIFGSALSSQALSESPLEEGKQRVRWTCRCGHKLYDDFESLEPAALQELEHQLNQYGKDGKDASDQDDKDPEKQDHSSRVFSTIWTWITSHISDSVKDSRSPARDTEGQRSLSNDVNSQKVLPKAENKSLHLLCCLPTSVSSEGFKLCHEPLNDIATDRELFRLLRKAFYGHSSTFSIKKAKCIRIVKFLLAPNNYVDIHDHAQSCQSAAVPCTCLPPAPLVEPSPSATYLCSPIAPAAPRPPIGPRFLKHEFDHPSHQGKEDIWFYTRIPKWTARFSLNALSDEMVEGWGIQIECELHQRKVKLLMLGFVLLGAVGVALGYYALPLGGEKKDLQTLSGIEAVWIALCVGFGTIGYVVL